MPLLPMRNRHVPAELHQLVAQRAGNQCEYCLMSENVSLASFETDHIVARKHGGKTEEENLAYCCPLCNKHKGTDVASYDLVTGELTPLYHPRHDRWPDHFSVQEDGALLAKTAVARITIRLLQLNRIERIKERQLLIRYQMLRTPD
jgi:hypothetical protein